MDNWTIYSHSSGCIGNHLYIVLSTQRQIQTTTKASKNTLNKINNFYIAIQYAIYMLLHKRKLENFNQPHLQKSRFVSLQILISCTVKISKKNSTSFQTNVLQDLTVLCVQKCFFFSKIDTSTRNGRFGAFWVKT